MVRIFSRWITGMKSSCKVLRSRAWWALLLFGLLGSIGFVGCSSLPIIVPDLARPLRPGGAAGRRARPAVGRAKQGDPRSPGEPRPGHRHLRPPPGARRGHRRQPADHRQPGAVAAGRPGHLPGDVRGHPGGPGPHQHGDLHPRRRRGRPAFCAGADRQAAAGRAGQPDPRQRRHPRHAGGLLRAPDRQRHPGARVQPDQPAGWRARTGS